MGYSRVGLVKTTKTVFTSTLDPTVNDDNITSDKSRGHLVGDIWVNTSTGNTFVNTDVTAGAAVWNQIGSGGQVQRVSALFDATEGVAVGAVELNLTLPAGATIIKSEYMVLTTFTSATDAATIALSVASDTPVALRSAIAISNGANPWDAGALTAAATGSTDTAGVVTATVAVEALTAGKLVVVIEYVVL